MFVAQYRLKMCVQKIMCVLREFFDFSAYHPVREIKKVALAETVKYIADRMENALGFYTGKEVLEYAFTCVKTEGMFLEFGVFKGGSIRFIAESNPQRKIHGFDSFEGLPEDWSGTDAASSTFSLRGRLPKVPSCVSLHPGWFDKSLPSWLEKYDGNIAFIHIDCDLYTSTKTILSCLAPRIKPGVVVVFDEYFHFPNWKKHEFLAFKEFVKENKVTYEYLAYSRMNVAIKILEIN